MAKTTVLIGFVASLLFLSLIAYSFPAFAQGSDSTGKPEVIGVTGFVPGKNLTVHVLVLVHPGEDKNEVAAAALASQGARPFTAEEYSLTGLVWNQFNPTNPAADEVLQYYNPAGDPSVGTIAESILLNTHDSWTNVETSIFKFSYGGETTNCPSLVRECQGRQQYDSQNDVAWMDLRDKDTLAVTWSGTSSSTGPEADVAMNTKFTWDTIVVHEEKVFDIQTVLLHELGHVAGVGHSTVPNTTMYPSYTIPNRELQQDDKDAISFLYPLPQVGDSPTVSITSPTGTTFANNELIIFSATATDTEDGSLTSVDWSSDIDGSLDTGASIDVNTLTNNAVHTITASVTDSDGNSSSDSVTITVGTPIEPPSSDAETANIDYKIRKGPNGGLIITVTLLDGTDAPVTETSVKIQLFLNGQSLADATGDTNSEGKVNFRLSNPVKSGIYETTVLEVAGAVWDNGNTNDPGFTK